MNGVDVRPARRADIGELSHVLARAFYDDPVAKREVPDDVVRKGKLAPFVDGVDPPPPPGGRRARSRGTRRDDQRGRGVGSARPMALPATRRTENRCPGWSGRSAGICHAREAMKNAHPDEPHWYLAIVGSDPGSSGRGFGHALMRSRLDRCRRREHPVAYSRIEPHPDNVPYYRRFGFEVTGEISRVPHDGPRLWPMWLANPESSRLSRAASCSAAPSPPDSPR